MEYVKQAWGSNTTADIEKHIEETCLTHVTFDYVREHTREAVLAAQKSSSALPTINSQWLEYAEWSKVTHAGRVMPLNTSDRQKLGRADLWGKFGRILKKNSARCFVTQHHLGNHSRRTGEGRHLKNKSLKYLAGDWTSSLYIRVKQPIRSTDKERRSMFAFMKWMHQFWCDWCCRASMLTSSRLLPVVTPKPLL